MSEQNLAFGQTLFQHRKSDVLVLFGHSYIELCIVGVLLLIEAEGRDNLSYWRYV